MLQTLQQAGPQVLCFSTSLLSPRTPVSNPARSSFLGRWSLLRRTAARRQHCLPTAPQWQWLMMLNQWLLLVTNCFRYELQVNVLRPTQHKNVNAETFFLAPSLGLYRLITNAVVVPNPHYCIYTANSNPIPTVFLWRLSPFLQYYCDNYPLYHGKYCSNSGLTAISIPMSIFSS